MKSSKEKNISVQEVLDVIDAQIVKIKSEKDITDDGRKLQEGQIMGLRDVRFIFFKINNL